MLNEVIERFRFQGRLVDQRPYGSGHINDTYLLTFENGNEEPGRAILQRMNKRHTCGERSWRTGAIRRGRR